MLYRQMFFAVEPRIYSSLEFLTGPKMRLLIYKLAATNYGVILSTYSIREMEYIIRQSWNWWIWKKNCPNLLLLVVGDCVLMIPL